MGACPYILGWPSVTMALPNPLRMSTPFWFQIPILQDVQRVPHSLIRRGCPLSMLSLN